MVAGIEQDRDQQDSETGKERAQGCESGFGDCAPAVPVPGQEPEASPQGEEDKGEAGEEEQQAAPAAPQQIEAHPECEGRDKHLQRGQEVPHALIYTITPRFREQYWRVTCPAPTGWPPLVPGCGPQPKAGC